MPWIADSVQTLHRHSRFAAVPGTAFRETDIGDEIEP